MPRPKRSKIISDQPAKRAARPANDPKRSRAATLDSIEDGQSDPADSVGHTWERRTGRARKNAQEHAAVMSGEQSADVTTAKEASRMKGYGKGGNDVPDETTEEGTIGESVEAGSAKRTRGNSRALAHSSKHRQNADIPAMDNHERSKPVSETTFPHNTVSASGSITASPSAHEPSQPFSVSRAQNTPSFISMKNFKKRPRQPSILSMVKQRLAGGIDQEREDSMDDTLNDSLAGSADSPPHSAQSKATPRSSSSKKRKRTDLGIEDDEASALSEAPTEAEEPGFANINEHLSEDPEEEHSSVRRSSRVSAKHKERPQASENERIPTSPLSTPSQSLLEDDPPRSTRQKLDSSKQERSTKRQKVKNPKTADLFALLPKPRRRPERNLRTLGPRTEFDIHSSSSAEDVDQESDGDELQQRPQRRGGRSVLNTLTSTNSTKPKSKSERSTKHQTGSRSRPRISKTYTRQRNGDQENVGNDEESDEEGSTVYVSGGGYADEGGSPKANKKSKELSEAAKKFAEIDAWELEFESCDLVGGSSSPWR